MKQFYKIVVFWFLISGLFAQSPTQLTNKPQSFVIANDWRYKATEKYQRDEYTLGTVKAIEKVGKGDFLISCGDVSPVDASRALISKILGKDYFWYTAPGNHDQEDTTFFRLLRKMNAGGMNLPHVVRKGPSGCEETTYSFEIGDCHVAILNLYFDGKSDIGTDGDVVPELLKWLEEDLKNNKKTYTFVVGHEPLLAQPDMDNGRIRHQGDSLDKYYRNAQRLHDLLKKYGVTAYLNGHTHGASIVKINGVWQIDAGHAYGIEDLYPEFLFSEISNYIQTNSASGKDVDEMIGDFFRTESYSIKKVLYYTELTGGISYKQFADEPALLQLTKFYYDYKQNPKAREKYVRIFEKNWDLSRSTFIKVILEKPAVKVEVYRDDSKGGSYQLMHTEILK